MKLPTANLNLPPGPPLLHQLSEYAVHGALYVYISFLEDSSRTSAAAAGSDDDIFVLFFILQYNIYLN